MSEVKSALGAHDTRVCGEAPPAIQIAGEQPVEGAPHARCLRVNSPGGVVTRVHVVGFGLTDGGASTASIAGGRLLNTPRADDGSPLEGTRLTPTAIVFRERGGA